jgi:hypothetical protein
MIKYTKNSRNYRETQGETFSSLLSLLVITPFQGPIHESIEEIGFQK